MHMQTNTDKDLPVTPAQDAAFTRFITRYDQIFDCIEAVDPAAYARTRNFVDGAVTRLSPYISRGLISTRMLMRSVLARDPGRNASEKLLQELAVPEVMRDTDVPALTVDLPVNDTLDIDPQLPTLVYNYYMLICNQI